MILCTFILNGCKSAEPYLAYNEVKELPAFSVDSITSGRADAYTDDLCVVTKDDESVPETDVGRDTYASAAVFDISNARTLYSVNVYEKLYPASLTKVMTAIVAMKYSQKEDIITCSENVKIKEPGAQVCGVAAGDKITMDQAMHGLLMYSGNDVAVAIAENISGSIEDFADLMNQEAAKIGATHTHFVNPNGLHDEDHYTTAYDMYLIFNEAVKYDWFNEIISKDTYITTYETADGGQKEVTWNTTNLYLKGDKAMPEGVTVIGGKTGTTNAALNNLVLLSKDNSGREYISIVMRSKQRDMLYDKMSSILDIVK